MVTKIKELFFKNKNTAQTIAKNTFWLFFGQISGRLLRAALIIFAARSLGPSSWGAFSYVMSLIAFMLIFSDIGMTAIVTRESSRNTDLSRKYFVTAFFIKIILLAAGAAIVIWLAPYFTKIEEAKILLPLASIILIFDSLRNFGFALSRAAEKMQLEAFNEIFTNILITIFGFYFLSLHATSYNLTVAYLLGIIGGSLITLFSLKNYIKEIFTRFDHQLIKPIISASLPFALASFLGAIMINTDLIMIGWLRTSEELGFYSAAQKPILLFYVFASLFATALFPVLAKANADKEKFKVVLEKSLTTAIVMAVPFTAGGIMLGDQIINLLFGAVYAPAVTAFKILSLTLLIIYPSVIISNSILACNKQKNFIIFSLLGALSNVFFNFLLIPFWGIAGAALSTILTQIAANIFIWHKMKMVQPFSILPQIKKISLITIIIVGSIFFLKLLEVPLIINVFLSAIIYLLLLWIFRKELLRVR